MLALLWLAGPASGGETGMPVGGEKAGRLHVTVDLIFTYGIGAYSALGAQTHALGQVSVWNTRHATGTFDFGVLLGAQREPMALQYGAAPGQTNDAQRLNAWASIGHTLHLGARRRSGLGLHLFAGWTHVWSQAKVVNAELAIDRRVRDDYGLLNSGLMLKYDYRFSRYVGLRIEATAPFWSVQPSYVATIFHVGVGLTGYLR